MQMHLYRVAIECGQIVTGNDVAMQYDLHGLTINPFGNLAIMGYYQEHVFYEGHVLLYSPEQIS